MNKRKSVSLDDLPAGACLVEVSSDGGNYYILPVYQQLIAAVLHPKCLESFPRIQLSRNYEKEAFCAKDHVQNALLSSVAKHFTSLLFTLHCRFHVKKALRRR